ncbi:MAG TPA: class I tRNA ligase family protein, partial [Chitinophagaceae bacterium]|nr:class I tRNA ligase family protein [Chitinophagaceae bacterium]
MEYNFRDIERKWQKQWKDSQAYKVKNDFSKPKYYVLDMFPYPSGAGLHVGHPLGYIASDIFSRYKRLKGFNVLHPMGFDSFGLPAEQYALDTGQHPAVTTKKNIETFKKQLDNIGFCYDWDREVQTSDPNYYKWTQWIFLQLFDSFYNRQTSKAGRIAELTATFELEGNVNHPCPGDVTIKFTAVEWRSFDEKQKMNVLMEYRLAFCGYGEVNWCEALGTVLANDEVVNGVSERGGHPVVKKKLRQWYLRITEYADRLLEGLDRIEFSDAMKEMQTNWIGKSSGAEIDFAIKGVLNTKLRVYTTRPDTIFGADFMVIAPELELVKEIKSEEQTAAVDEYLAYVKSRSERER